MIIRLSPAACSLRHAADASSSAYANSKGKLDDQTTARETAFKVLFQVDVGKIDVDDAMIHMLDEDQTALTDISFLRRLVEGTIANLPEIERVIAETAVEWKLERMLATDRNILRLAVYEILYCPDIPDSATVNEAV